MHWQLTREVFGPNIKNIAGVDNKLSDTLSRLPSTTRILYMQKLRLNVKECCMGDSHWKSLGLTYRIQLELTKKYLERLVGAIYNCLHIWTYHYQGSQLSKQFICKQIRKTPTADILQTLSQYSNSKKIYDKYKQKTQHIRAGSEIWVLP